MITGWVASVSSLVVDTWHGAPAPIKTIIIAAFGSLIDSLLTRRAQAKQRTIDELKAIAAARALCFSITSGRKLVTLRGAGDYKAALPDEITREPHCQLAARHVLDAAERGGILMLAEIAMRRAINQGKPKPAPEPRKKREKGYKII